MLLNLSNHPSTNWSDAQLAEARARYGAVEDLAFPHIDPSWDEAAVRDLAAAYVDQVSAMLPAAVHLMGEMTFSFALVQQLQTIGIPCIASTTERKVRFVEGEKVVTFRFVRFRSY